MELRHLKYFRAVAEAASFSKAAARLHVTQPALSRQIRDLEEELGCQLFDRTRGRIASTPAAKVLLEGAGRVLTDLEELIARTRQARNAQTPAIRLAHSCTLDTHFIVPYLQSSGGLHPRCEVVEFPPDEAFAALHAGTIDTLIAVRPGRGLLRGLEGRTLWRIRPMAALPAKHSFAHRRRVTLKELRHEAWAVWNEDRFPGYGDSFVEACRRAGFRPRVVQKVESLGTIFSGVAGGQFLSYVAPVAQQVPHPGVVLVALAWDLEQLPPVMLLWRERSRHAAALEALAQTIATGRAQVQCS